MSDKKRVAAITDPVLVAATGGFYSFKTRAQAFKALERIHQAYILSREQETPSEGSLPTLKLWIHGYAVSGEEQEMGYLGHFARISVCEAGEGRYSLAAEKILTPVDHHPQKKRPPAPHPNKGHPILRAAAKSKAYATMEAARVELVLLHEEFPDATTPGPDTLHVLVYNRKSEGVAPIQKVTLLVKEQEDGTAKLIMMQSVKPKAPRKTKITETSGKYTAMLKKQRKK